MLLFNVTLIHVRRDFQLSLTDLLWLQHSGSSSTLLFTLIISLSHLLVIMVCSVVSGVVGFAGENAILPCSLTNSGSDDLPTVEWSKEGLKPNVVFLYRNGCETFEMKNLAFEFRTSLFMREVKNGNVSLRISNVKPSDAGIYQCLIIQRNGSREATDVQLVVALVSDPRLSVDSDQNQRVTVACEATCWLPAPLMEIVDEKGKNITDTVEIRRADPTECYTVRQTNKSSCFLLFLPFYSTLGKKVRIYFSWLVSEPTNYSIIYLLTVKHYQLPDILRDSWTNIKLKVTKVDVLLTEPKTRDGLLHHSKEITLDPNTANRNLFLSEGNQKVIRVMQQQSYPDHPDRFTDYKQVLSRESLTGRCYWEVEWTGRGVGVAVSYKSIRRSEGFGFNDKSWSLYCTKDGNTFFLDDIETPVSGPVSSRIGVYLDHRAGILCFYSVSETMTLLHRVQTRFTQPLHAGICLYNGSSAELIKPEQPLVTIDLIL
uniref:B30.2/SPRY domain-containing protein n=1 Tax=Xiphophorus couchianus TaxID=32473 RepID=A0A3B5LHG3_9TELE